MYKLPNQGIKWITKGKIWLLGVFLLFFLSHLLSVYRSLSTGRWEMDQARAGQGKTERDLDNAGGDRNAGRYRGQTRLTGTSSVICVFFLLNSSTHSSSFQLPLFPQSATIGRAGRDVINA